MAPYFKDAIKVEIDNLKWAEFIREAEHLEWIVNIVVIKKPNRKVRVCINFTDLNVACLKDIHLLPLIDILVIQTTHHKMLSLIAEYIRNNQIQLVEKDQEYTTIIIESNIYYFTIMPSGLKKTW